MHIIVTMAGLGSRFREVGYNCPKYMIEAKGKTLFRWSMISLSRFFAESEFIFIPRKEDDAKDFIVAECNGLGIKRARIIEVDHNTDGQATTAMLAISTIIDEESILIFNIDTYIEEGSIVPEILTGDGSIPCFHAPGDHWSFVKAIDGRVVDVTEKVRISDNCSLGIYYFKNAQLYSKAYKEFYSAGTTLREKYIAPMYRYLLDNNYQVTYSIIERDAVHVLGTPDELAAFIAA